MRYHDLTERQKKEFAKMYEKPQLYSIQDISDRFGVSPGRVVEWAKAMNLIIRIGRHPKQK